MIQFSFPILTFVTFIPLAGAMLLLFLPKSNVELIRRVAFGTVCLDLLVSIPLFLYFRNDTANMQFVEQFSWIPEFGVQYYMGIDGISLLLVLLTTFTGAVAILSTWSAITRHVKEFMISMLLLQTGMIGVFVSLDFFLFYVFWEVMLIPMYFIIGIWGGPRKVYAAIKFFLFTMFGSVLMLVAILYLYFQYESLTGQFSLEILNYYGLGLTSQQQFWLFLAFFLAFAIKVPMFPFHTWLPDAHVEAPTAGSVILAGVLLKMGTYGFLRFSLPMFPQATMDFLPLISILAIIGIIYGALVAMVQTDVKSLVAFSSVSHLGFVVLGIFALNLQGIEGGILQMINHGLSTGALFLLVGIIYERRHTRLLSEFGGLSKVMPVFAVVFMIVTLSSIGLPGLNGFVGEFLILLGAFKANPWYAVFATIGVILGAVYMLWMFQRVMFGEIKKEENKSLPDLNKRELAYLVPILFFCFWIGVYPSTFTNTMHASVEGLIKTVESNQISSKIDPPSIGKKPETKDEMKEALRETETVATKDVLPEPNNLNSG